MMALVDAVGGLPPPVALAIRIKDELDTAVLETEKALLALGAVRLGGDGPTSTDPDDDEVNDPRRKCRFYAINTKKWPGSPRIVGVPLPTAVGSRGSRIDGRPTARLGRRDRSALRPEKAPSRRGRCAPPPAPKPQNQHASLGVLHELAC